MSECVFCRIVARQIPASVVHEEEHALAFMDLGQVNPGHVLVAAKAHVENLFGLEAAQAAGIAGASVRVARAIRSVFAPQGLSVCRYIRRTARRPARRFSITTCIWCPVTRTTAWRSPGR